MHKPSAGFSLVLTCLTLTACAQHSYVPGPGMSGMALGPEAAQCRLFARGSSTSRGFGAAGSARFVAAATAVALIAGGIAGAIEQNTNYNDCMQARGWRIAEVVKPAPVAALAPELVPVSATAAIPASPTLSVRADMITADMASSLDLNPPRGVVLLDVGAGGVAAAAGLRPDDVILSFNGSRVSGVGDIQRELARIAPHAVVNARVWRDSREISVSLRF